MPQIRIEYSANAAASFDRHALASSVHELIASTVDTELANCKTRIVELGDVVIGDGSDGQGMIHVEIRILSGRPDAQKRRLGEAVMSALESAVRKLPQLKLQLTVEVRDLDRDNYHKRLV